MTLNTFNVIQSPNRVVHQYDVSTVALWKAFGILRHVQVAWGSNTDATKRVLVKKIWNSKAVKTALDEPKSLWIYDGNKLAW